MDEREISQRLSEYEFYHIIRLTENLSTPGNLALVEYQTPVLLAVDQLDLRQKRVLDVGCRDGLCSFAAERRGAGEVIGIDNDISRGAVEFLIPYFGSSVRMHQMNVLDLRPTSFGKFDVIIFAGVLYHLRYPMWVLKLLTDVVQPGGTLILETAVFYGFDKHAMLYCPIGAESPYEPTSCTFFNKKGLKDTLSSLGWRTLSMSSLYPEREAAHCPGQDPVTDRAVFVCEYTGQSGNQHVTHFWHGTHSMHTQFGGDGTGAMASGQLDWKQPWDGS